MTILVIALAALVACSSWAATQLVESNGAFALAARGGHVAFSLGDYVLLTDDEGSLISVASDSAGQPWRFGEVASVSFDETSRLFVSDLERREVVRFDALAHGGERIPLAEPPELAFEYLSEGDLRVIADTMGHHVQTLKTNGAVDRSRRVVYPNGITRTTIGGVPALVFAETGQRTARAWSLELEPIDWPVLAKLNGDLQRRKPRDLLELTVTPQGGLLAADCPSPRGECTILRVDAQAERIDRVADIVPFVAPDPEAADGLIGVAELAATSKGSVLVASPRLGAIVEFSNDQFEAPPGEFCERCDGTEYGPAIDVRSLATPLTWKNGARIRRFGDAAVQARVEALWSARHTYSRLERGAQAGTWLIATVLLIALFLSRQAGGTSAQPTKLEQAIAQLLRPQLPVLLLVMAPVVLAFLAAFALGQLFLGAAGSAGLGVACGVLAARLLVPRLYVSRQHPEAGARAFELFLRAHVDEPLQWARFVVPRRSLMKHVVATTGASQFDDLLDALEVLAPRLTLLIKTQHKLISVPTSLLGAPLGPFVELDAADAPASPEGVGSLAVFAPKASWRWMLGAGAATEVTASAVTVRCEQCGKRVGTCDHTEVDLAVPVLATFVFPGLGALIQGNLAQARVSMLVALGFLLEVLRVALPQHLGTLPLNVDLWLQPLGGYVMTAFGAAFAIAVSWRQARRRIALASPKESS